MTADRRTAGDWRRLAALGVLALLLVGGSALLGRPALTASDLADWRSLFDSELRSPFWDLRVPRTLLAASVGAGLALGGVVFQVIFRNPLASPYTLGVDAGASLGAAVALYMGLSSGLAGAAFAGASLALLLVYGVASLRDSRDVARLLLGGLCVAYLASAGVTLTAYLGGRDTAGDIVFWMMGSLGNYRPAAIAEILACLLVTLAATLLWRHALDALALGPELAGARGVPVRRVVSVSLALVGLLTAVSVANCGPIGFVGVMVPHMARGLVGARSGRLLIGSALLGAGFLAVCDGLTRCVGGFEPPVGVLTNLIGGAFFFYLLATRDLSGAPR